jgi:hypothetical protein
VEVEGQNNYVNNTTEYILKAIMADKTKTFPTINIYSQGSIINVITTYDTQLNYTSEYYIVNGKCLMATGIYDIKDYKNLIEFLKFKFTLISVKANTLIFLEDASGEGKYYTWELVKISSESHAIIMITEKKRMYGTNTI